MIKTNKFKSAVREIVSLTRTYIPEIGDYVKHYATGDFKFIVHLTNGKLTMPEEAAHNYETMPGNVSENWIEEIANSFQHHPSKPYPANESTAINRGWKKILSLFGIRK